MYTGTSRSGPEKNTFGKIKQMVKQVAGGPLSKIDTAHLVFTFIFGREYWSS